MDNTSLKVLQLWKLSTESGKIPRDEVASAVYYGLTDNAPPVEVRQMTNVGQLLDYFQTLETGHPFTDAEHMALGQQFVEMHTARTTPSLGAIRLLLWLPNIAIVLAIVAVILGPFSWLVIGLSLAAKIQNGFARFLAGQGHKAAGLHISIALILILASFVVSLIHIFSSYQFF